MHICTRDVFLTKIRITSYCYLPRVSVYLKLMLLPMPMSLSNQTHSAVESCGYHGD